MTRRVLRECVRCRRVRPHVALGYCTGCYTNRPGAPVWVGRQPTGTGAGGPGVQRGPADVAARIEDYAELRALGLSRLDAATRMGLSYRTALRYEQRLTRQGAAA